MTGRKEKPWRSKSPVILSNSDVDKESDDSNSVDQLSKNDSENCSEVSTLPENLTKSVDVDEVKSDLDKWKRFCVFMVRSFTRLKYKT